MNIKKLTADDITPQFVSELHELFKHTHSQFTVRREFVYPVSIADENYFLNTWRECSISGIAHTWEIEPKKAILGALIAPNLFTGNLQACLTFWGARPGCSALPLLKSLENTACELNCKLIYASALDNNLTERMEKLYRRKGYFKAETLFVRVL